MFDTLQTGIIPAYAGSTGHPPPDPAILQDHPRIRGEHSDFAASKSTPRGSSPHTRGAPTSKSSSALPGRIIPAYAGSTRRCTRSPSSAVDHPRIRGEHPSIKTVSWFSPGSSPHTRGARRHYHLPLDRGRIIPAYAGSTRRSRSPRARPADHPRIRGEHGAVGENSLRRRGSSPHTRGALACVTLARRPRRIIPAYAGSTVVVLLVEIGELDHPRIRGEHIPSG